MNNLVEFEAQELTALFAEGDMLSIKMFMETMGMPCDVQDRLISEISSLKEQNRNEIGQIIESYGQSHVTDRLNY